MAARLTQEYTEVLTVPTPNVRLTWIGTEVLTRPTTANVRLTQIYIEYLTPASVIYERSVTSTETISQNIVCNVVKNLSVTSTLTPTQDILAYNQIAVEHELDITQQIAVQKIITKDVTSTLTISQTTARVIPLDVTSTLTLTQDDPESIKQKVANHVSTLVIGQANELLRVINRRIDSNIFLTQTIFKNFFTPKGVGSILNLTQIISATNARPVKNTLTFTQDIDVDKAKFVKNIITFTQTMARQIVATRTYIQLFTPYQILTRNVIYKRTVTNNLTLAQQIVVDLTKQVTSLLTLTQMIEVLSVKHVQHLLEFFETIHLNQVRNLSMADELLLEQQIVCNKVYFRGTSNTLGFEQTLKARKAYLREVTNTFVIGQEVYRTRYNRTVTSTFTPANVITKSWVASRTVAHNLNLVSSVGKSNIYSRTITSNLVFLREYHALIGDHEFTMPTIYVAKAQRYTVLTGATRTIILPNPEFSDAESNTGNFSLRRGMAGKVYTYVKKTDFRKLNYTFHIGRTKAKELMDFLIENNTNVITLNNFKGETWFVYIISNPNDLTTQGRFASSCNPDRDREKVSVTLEFEGVKIGSPLVNSPIVRR